LLDSLSFLLGSPCHEPRGALRAQNRLSGAALRAHAACDRARASRSRAGVSATPVAVSQSFLPVGLMLMLSTRLARQVRARRRRSAQRHGGRRAHAAPRHDTHTAHYTTSTP
jgi:hypothetical protein